MNSSQPAEQQTIEQLQQRYNALHIRKIQAETTLQNAEKQLQQLQREAREKYGTDDLEQLQQQLQKMREENEARRSSYQEDLDRLESELTAVETRFQAAVDAEESAEEAS